MSSTFPPDLTPYPPQKVFFIINSQIMPTPNKFTWGFPKVLGITGNGKSRYEPFWSLTVSWDYMNWDEYSLLLTTYNGSISGYVQIQVPLIYGDTKKPGYTLTGTYRWGAYPNVLLDAPIAGDYVDNNYFQNVKMTVRRIVNVRNGPPVAGLFFPNIN